MNTVVIYKSKTGFAKKYAEWIAKDLSADIFDISKITINKLNKYDTIIYGGSLYAVGINGVKLITNNMDKLKDKKVIVFSTGVSPLTEDGLNDVRNKNFTADQQKHIKFFYLRGGFNYSKLTPFDKVLMTLLKWKIKIKKEKQLTTDEKGMLALYQHPVDFTKKKNIDEIINYVTS
ncbi:flavodoxin domain-containing protein [Clostridium bowmanii]|uniref:flavodoxin domain-containing protein n=1 Tax=Clostridium bowmanii TaxID=132925 RepID=UPI001C0CA5DF|nr:flavodoxin domain-containing protein [Clostridium bowmanii]MBU3191060.1 flavodoxin domain-containing protein [Clostridium bowmanii]MCA1075506.1 flavodoxin domain-containing protein [Clostridium bowmanii]